MKINREIKEVKMKFASVARGDVFMHEDDVYIKIDPLPYKNGVIINAIDLSTGEHASVEDTTGVQLVGAELTVKEIAT
jgi:hypothetical protein